MEINKITLKNIESNSKNYKNKNGDWIISSPLAENEEVNEFEISAR